MPSSYRFILKDSPAEVLQAADVAPQGRTYAHEHSLQPGGIRAEELTLGVQLACLAITDDKEKALAKVGIMNPWQIEALKLITGSEEEAHRPLTYILIHHFGLICDKIIDIVGFTAAGHALDTQGYIAHNDDIIVLAYRCTTTGFDWITNMTTTSSAWEVDDIAKGHSSCLSCIVGECGSDPYKPRVHTGFYNNFLSTVPDIRQYIEPLLDGNQPPRKLYVVGHSLGAGIATMATCYFLTEFNWANLPHRFINVTAGSPRSCRQSMQTKIENIMTELRPLDKAVICRIVRDKDSVASVPPELFGFRHLDKLVYITKDGAILVGPKLNKRNFVDKRTMNRLLSGNPALAAEIAEKEDSSSDEDDEEVAGYDKRIQMIPRGLRDHMPGFYLQPLMKLYDKERDFLRGEKEHRCDSSTTLQSNEGVIKTKCNKRRLWRVFGRRNEQHF